MSGDELLTPKEVAAVLKVATGTLANWRTLRPGLLPFLRIGRLIRYRRVDVDRLTAALERSGAR